MAPRRKKLLILGSTLVAIAGTIFLTCDREPRYGGHSLSYWVSIHGDSQHYPRAELERSDEAIRQIGTNAIPYLLKWISEEQSRSKTIIAINVPIRWLNQKLAPRADWSFKDNSWILQAGASGAFAALDRQAKPAIPELERMLFKATNFGVKILAAQALGHLGKLGLVPLTQAITNSDPDVRGAAVGGLGILGHGNYAEPAIPLLAQALVDNDPRVTMAAFSVKGLLKLDPALVVQALIPYLASDSPHERIMAARILADYQSLAQPALPALLNALDKTMNYTDPNERGEMLKAIPRIDPHAITNAPSR